MINPPGKLPVSWALACRRCWHLAATPCESINPALERGGDGGGPDFKTFGHRIKVVGGAETNQPAFVVQKLGIDVGEENVLLVVELGDNFVGFLAFAAIGIIGASAARKDGDTTCSKLLRKRLPR